MQSYTRSLLILSAFLVLLDLMLVAVVGLHRPPWGDESHFVQTVQDFGDDLSLHTLTHYQEMSGPLPFVVYACWGKLFGFGLTTLRFLSILIALLLYIIFHRLLYDLVHDGLPALLVTVFLAVHPYMVGLSIFVFTDGMTILFILFGCFAVHRRIVWLLLLSATGALLCRQYAIFFVVAAFIYSVIAWRQNRDRQSLGMALAALISVVPLGLLMLLWGGLSPDNSWRYLYLDDGLSYHPAYLTLYISLLSIYLLPIIIARWKLIYGNLRLLLICFIISWLYWVMPVAASPQARAIDVDTVGLFHKLLIQIWSIPWFSHAIFYVGFLFGLPVVAASLTGVIRSVKQRRVSYTLFLDLAIISFLIVMPFSYLCWEKYFLPLVPIVSMRLLLLDIIPSKII